MVICLERSANDLHMVRLMPLPPHHLCFSKIQNGLSFWYQPTQVVLEKSPLNGCVCVCVILAVTEKEGHLKCMIYAQCMLWSEVRLSVHHIIIRLI